MNKSTCASDFNGTQCECGGPYLSTINQIVRTQILDQRIQIMLMSTLKHIAGFCVWNMDDQGIEVHVQHQ